MKTKDNFLVKINQNEWRRIYVDDIKFDLLVHVANPLKLWHCCGMIASIYQKGLCSFLHGNSPKNIDAASCNYKGWPPPLNPY